MRGFDLLFEELQSAKRKSSDPRQQIKSIIESYITFGINNPDYYEIMFLNRTVPKYLDCVGTETETMAKRERVQPSAP